MVGGDEENYAIQIRHVLNGRNTLCIPVQNIEHRINKLDKNIYLCSDVYMQILNRKPWLHLKCMFLFDRSELSLKNK